MFEGQPKGLWTLALSNTGERFGYYTMLAVFALFLGENFGFDAGTASEIYTWFLTAVYFLPLVGGMAAICFCLFPWVTVQSLLQRWVPPCCSSAWERASSRVICR